jgi:quercetin dioxygenase-like cupin family protein
MDPTLTAHVCPPGEGPVFAAVGDVFRVLVDGQATGGAFAMIEVRTPPGGGPPPHVHHREEETFYVLEGEVTFYADGEARVVQAGGTVFLPRGREHTFRNEGSAPTRMLVLATPAGFERFLQEVAHPLPSADAPPPPVTAEDIERVLAVAPRYGIEIRLPG